MVFRFSDQVQIVLWNYKLISNYFTCSVFPYISYRGMPVYPLNHLPLHLACLTFYLLIWHLKILKDKHTISVYLSSCCEKNILKQECWRTDCLFMLTVWRQPEVEATTLEVRNQEEMNVGSQCPFFLILIHSWTLLMDLWHQHLEYSFSHLLTWEFPLKAMPRNLFPWQIYIP